MASLKRIGRVTSVPMLIAALVCVSGCTEIRAVISVFGSGGGFSMSAFEIDEMMSGNQLTCSVMGDRTVRCLGSGARGNLGRFQGLPVNSLKEVKQIAMGRGFSCAIVGEKNEVFCFGRNDRGQLGNLSAAASVDPLPVLDADNGNAQLLDAKQITAGESHACALLKSGKAVCWGDNTFGQIGNPSLQGVGLKTVLDNERSLKPFSGIQEIVAGANSTCVIAKEAREAFCFGERFGSTRKLNWVPEGIEMSGAIGNLSQIKAIGVGRGFACALGKSSQVYCWGINDMGQLGSQTNGAGTTKANLVEVSYPVETALTKIDALAVGDKHACALHRDEKTVYCWGDNRFGQLGNTSIRGLPEQVALGSNNLTLKGVRDLAAGTDRTCIISSRDEVFCWGNGADGILGSEKVISPYPVRVLDVNGELLGGISKIAIGSDHTCAIDLNQKLFCFGLNQFGQLGSRNVAGQVLNRLLKPVNKVTSLDVFGSRTCLVHGENQEVACFGEKEIDNINQKNEINSFTIEDVKRDIAPYKGAVAVVVGKSHLCVVNSEQHVDCMGDGAKGQLGIGENVTAKFGEVIDEHKKPLTDIWQMRSNGDFNCALKQESGSIACWGDWKGDHWLYSKIIPYSNKPSADFIQVTLNDYQVCGVHGADRSAYCTSNFNGKLDSLNLEPLTDQEGHPLKKILLIARGKEHFCALDEEGKVYCWGSNEFGQLGVKGLKDAAKPVKVNFKNEALRKISRISAGDHYTCVSTLEEASLFCFGQQFFGAANSFDPIEYPL